MNETPKNSGELFKRSQFQDNRPMADRIAAYERARQAAREFHDREFPAYCWTVKHGADRQGAKDA